MSFSCSLSEIKVAGKTLKLESIMLTE
jgi:hypothetical protein